VLEHQGDIDVAGPQHSQGFRRFGLCQHELDAGCLSRKARGGGRNQRAERGRERGEPHPALSLADVCRQLSLSGVQPADDLLGPVGE